MTTSPGYQPLFDPDAPVQPFDPQRAYRLGDRSRAAALPYVYDDDIILAVNVALAAGRPLLVRGHPGTGKRPATTRERNDPAADPNGSSPHTVSGIQAFQKTRCASCFEDSSQRGTVDRGHCQWTEAAYTR